jgi:hypothetical protein
VLSLPFSTGPFVIACAGFLCDVFNPGACISVFPIFHSLIGGSDYKLIYRHYATLYFVFCVDSSESELGILDLIQVGVVS